jgi:hypothetical protein
MSTGSVVTAIRLALESTPDARLSARLEEMSSRGRGSDYDKRKRWRDLKGNANRARRSLGLHAQCVCIETAQVWAPLTLSDCRLPIADLLDSQTLTLS